MRFFVRFRKVSERQKREDSSVKGAVCRVDVEWSCSYAAFGESRGARRTTPRLTALVIDDDAVLAAVVIL